MHPPVLCLPAAVQYGHGPRVSAACRPGPRLPPAQPGRGAALRRSHGPSQQVPSPSPARANHPSHPPPMPAGRARSKSLMHPADRQSDAAGIPVHPVPAPQTRPPPFPGATASSEAQATVPHQSMLPFPGQQCAHSGPPPTCRQMRLCPLPRMARRVQRSPRSQRGSGPTAATTAREAIHPGSTDRPAPVRYLDPHCSPLAKLRLHKEAPHACPQNADSSGARST